MEYKYAVESAQAEWYRQEYHSIRQHLLIGSRRHGKNTASNEFRWAFGLQGVPTGVVIH